MVGFVIITHGHVGKELCAAMEGILGSQPGVLSVSVDSNKPVETARAEIEEAIRNVNQGDGVIAMTDMFGGTPSNISLSFLEAGRVDVLTGVNLPMLIKGIALRKDHSLTELSPLLEQYGKQGIIVASELLKENQGSQR